MNKREAFNRVYKEIATTAIYSMEIANQIGYGKGINAIDMPREMALSVKQYGGGCCFHHSWRLIYHLQQAGIECYWACVPEPTEKNMNSQKCVVAYKLEDGQTYIADIVEDIKAGVKSKDFFDDQTCRRYDEYGNTLDNSRLTIEQMVNISDSPMVPGYLKIYPKLSDIPFFEYCNDTSKCECFLKK